MAMIAHFRNVTHRAIPLLSRDMSSVPNVFGKKFSFSDLPGTLQEYHTEWILAKFREGQDIFKSPENVKEALKSNEDFIEFWNKNCEGKPEAESYLSGSQMSTHLQYVERMSREYTRSHCHKQWNDIPASTIERIKLEFDALRPALYLSFLEKEAVRLNCDASEVRPEVSVLPLKRNRGQSKLYSLPKDIFVKILARLESIEIYRVAQVCKKWRHLVYNDASVLTKAEHSIYTHLLTFTEWTDQSKVVKGEELREHYISFGWGLIQWCSKVSQNLEILVLHKLKRPYGEIMHLLRQCPKLKHLQLKLGETDQRCRTKLQLPKLETLINEDSDCIYTSQFAVQAFTSANNLRVFKGRLYARDINSINEKRLDQDAFSNLMALQLVSPEYGLLEKLATLDQLQLKYLHLWDEFRLSQFRQHDNQHKINKRRNALHHLLSKQNKLEVLVSLWKFELDQSTIKLMTEHQQNLKNALLTFRVKNLDNEEGLESSDESDDSSLPSDKSDESSKSSEESDDGSSESSDGSDESSFDSTDGRDQFDDQDALVSFEEMLLEKDPSRDMSDFVFLIEDERSRSVLEDTMTGFSIYQDGDERCDMFEKWGLSHPAMRRRLGLDF